MKPSFIGIGAQKCASTWLHRVVAAHPSIAVPEVKEVDFFSYHFDHGYQWYEGRFGTSDPRLHAGEISPSYLHDKAAPERVRGYCPDVKILVTLRDPVQRAISNHLHEVRLGHIVGEDLSFETGLANNPMYVEQGLYAKHLRNWLNYFPRRQIFIALVDDIEADPVGVAVEVFRFLGVDDQQRPEPIEQRFNKGFLTRSQRLHHAKDRIYQASRVPALAWLWSMAVRVGARDLYRQFNLLQPEVRESAISVETEAALANRFSADLDSLESMLGRDLGHWRHDPVGAIDRVPRRWRTA
jgi:hypothetical protein